MWMKRTWRQRIYAKLPRWFKKHNFEIFAAILCILASLPLLFGNITPKSLESQLPGVLVFVWAMVLLIGPVLIILGIIGSYREPIKITRKIDYMTMEALGLTFLGWASFLYAWCILFVNLQQGWVASMITFIFMFTCFTEELNTQDRIDGIKSGIGVDPDA